jgi:hypothetical protein
VTGIGLADGAAEGLNPSSAGAAASGDFVPVNGVLLCAERDLASGKQQRAGGQIF